MDQSDPKAHHIQVDNALIGGYLDMWAPEKFTPSYLRKIYKLRLDVKIRHFFPSGGSMETGRWLMSLSSTEVTQKAGEPMRASWFLEAGEMLWIIIQTSVSLIMSLLTQASEWMEDRECRVSQYWILVSCFRLKKS